VTKEGRNVKKILTALAAVSAAALLAAGAGTAAPRQPMMLDCEGLGSIGILVPPAHGASISWGAAQILGDGHSIAVQFEFSEYDSTVGAMLFDSGPIAKGGGNANPNQPTTSCSLTQTATLADFLQPGDPTPTAPFALTDTVTFRIDVQVILK
jgi:hypothetical protein